jgi:hypothetical protein
MRDNELIIAVRAAVLARLSATSYGLGFLGLKQNYQPTQQGVPSAACLFMHKLFDKRIGSPQRKEQWNEELEQFDYIESEQLETTFQFTARAPQDPANDTELTPADYLKAAARALQSDPVLISLRSSGVGVLRIGDIRGGFAINDQGNFQEEPSFDVTFTHRNTTTDTLAPVVSREVIINRV